MSKVPLLALLGANMIVRRASCGRSARAQVETAEAVAQVERYRVEPRIAR